MRQSRSILSRDDGFSLIELLIALAMMGIILAAVFSFAIAQGQHLTTQEQVSQMAQTARATMDLLTQDLTMAGYNPTGAAFTGVTYTAAQLELKADLNGNGVATDPGETVVYTYDPDTSQILRLADGWNEPVADHIQSFVFDYLNASGNATTVSAQIRQVRVTLTARTGKPDPRYATNGGYRTYALASVITPRNLAY